MEDLFYSISSLFGTLKDFDSLSPDLLPMAGLLSCAGALILTRFTGKIGNLTVPVNLSALFIGAMLSNWLLQNLELPLENTVETPLAVSMVGMLLASFAMLRWMQGDSVRD